MTRKLRQTERVEFSVDDVSQVVARMERLAVAGDGWINLVPRITDDDDERPTSLGFLTLVGGGSLGVTMCSWIPGNRDRRGHTWTSLGISHVSGHRAVAELSSLAVPVPERWFVEQDHPRRGLVLRIPSDEPHERVLLWALRAAGVLTSAPTTRWRADVYLPATS